MHRTRFPFLALILVLLISACSQAPTDLSTPTLEPQFGTAADDQALEVAVQKRLGHIYVAGTSGNKVFLRQYRRNGTLNWERLISSSSSSSVYVLSLGTDENGNIYLAGKHDRYADDGYVAKYNKSGTRLWRKRFATLNDMAVDASGNLYLVGIDSVRKHTASGALVWARFPKRDWDVYGLHHVAAAASGKVVAVGREGQVVKYNNNGNNGRKLQGVYLGDGPSVADLALGPNEEIYLGVNADYEDASGNGPAIYALGAEGGYRWADAVVEPYNEPAGIGIATDVRGNAYLTGSYVCEDFYDGSGGYGCEEANDPNVGDAFVRKYTSSGSVVWTQRFGTSRFDTGSSVALFSDSELYVAGSTKGFLAEPNRGGLDAFLRKMNGSGTRIWTR